MPREAGGALAPTTAESWAAGQLATAGRLPPLPRDASTRWPRRAAAATLAAIPWHLARSRDDLVGRSGLTEGSGTSDLHLLEIGGWAAQCAGRRRFGSSTEAVAAPTPRRMTSSCRRIRPPTGAAVEAIGLGARRGLLLDVHPSNFARSGAGTVYLDDDFRRGRLNPTLGHTFCSESRSADIGQARARGTESREQDGAVAESRRAGPQGCCGTSQAGQLQAHQGRGPLALSLR